MGEGRGRGVTYISKVYSANTLHNGFQYTPNNRAYVTFPMVVMSTVHHDPGFSSMSARQHVFFFDPCNQLAELTVSLNSHIATCISGNSLLAVTAA